MTNEVAKKKQLPAFLVLTIICVIAALALAATNAVTKDPIAEHAAAARAANFSSVLTATTYEEVKREGANDGIVLVEAWNKGEIVDVVSGATVTSEAVIKAVNAAVKAEDLTATAKGFQSDVTVALTVDENGLITGLTIDSASETLGFGTRCAEDEAFINQFIGKAAPFVREEGLVGYCVSAAADGFNGPVAVTLGVNAKGEVVGAKIGDNRFRESKDIGDKWLKPEPVEQFIGVDLKAGGAIDVIAGATVTSDAVKAAANAGANALRAHMNIESDVPAFGDPKPIEYADSVAAGDYTATAKGYQSDVKVTFTVDENSTITALTIDSTGETPSIGTRCTEDASFAAQFIGKAVPVTEFDALSGATVTSNTVVKAINSVAAAGEADPTVETSADVPETEEVPAEESSSDALTASAKGLMSDVKVSITLNEDGTIAAMSVDCSGETAGLTDPCTQEPFLSQFIGKKGPFENVEVVSGATYTSNAVITAVNSLFPAEESSSDALTASAKGLMSDVKVSITLNEDGTIAAMSVDCSGETAGLTDPCTQEPFLSQFIGKKGPFENVEVVSGATYTSNAVITAVNSLFPAEEPAVEEVPAETPAEVPAADALTATVPAFGGADITVTVTLDENGNVAALVVDASTQTPGLGLKCAEDEFVNQFIGQSGPFVLGENVDAVSYATITSQAVVDAVNSFIPTQDMSVTGEELPIAEAPAAVLTATVPAFGGADITVTVTLDENGNVAALAVDASTQTPGLGLKCAEDEFVNQFIGQSGPFVLGENVDAVSYATITSQAVVDAVNSFIPTQDMSVTGEELPIAEAPAADLTATVPAFGGADITVTVTLDENGNVAALVVDASTQTPGLGLKCAEDEFVNQFIGQSGPFVLGENVDAVSYATITSDAVVKAVNELLGK